MQVIEWKGELELEEDPDKTIEYVCPPGMDVAGQPSAADVEMKEQEGQKAEEQSEGEKSTSESEKTESASENAEVKKDKEEEKTEAAKESPPERPYENPMLVHLFTQCRLIERILEAWEEDDLDRAQLPASRGRGSRRGYMGHLTKVTL